MDYYRLEKYGHVDGRLTNTTVANRAAGMDVNISPSKETSQRAKSQSAQRNNALSIPEQIRAIQDKKKFKRRAYVMPSQKAQFFKKEKLAQNLGLSSTANKEKKEGDGSDSDKEGEDNTMDVTGAQTEKKQKLKLKDIFKEEGMYHSISETMRRSFTLLKTPGLDYEKE